MWYCPSFIDPVRTVWGTWLVRFNQSQWFHRSQVLCLYIYSVDVSLFRPQTPQEKVVGRHDQSHTFTPSSLLYGASENCRNDNWRKTGVSFEKNRVWILKQVLQVGRDDDHSFIKKSSWKKDLSWILKL